MKRSIFAIRDDKAQGFPQAPFTSINADTAMRELAEVVNSSQKDTQLARTPEDFTLYHLGDWDMDTGAITAVEGGKRVVVNCVDLVKRGE